MTQTLRERRALLRPAWNRLSKFGALSDAHHGAWAEFSGDAVVHRRGSDLACGLAPGVHVIATGWACRLREMASGRRQIFLFLLPGDVIGSFRGAPDSSFFRSVALTRLETLEANALTTLDSSPEARAFVEAGRRAEDHAQGFLYGHMMRLGAGDAYCGMAHLLLELHDRLALAGLSEGAGGFALPIGQRVLAQALGVSVTHVNNTLQRMVADGLIAFSGRSVRLLQRERMIALANFEDGAAPAADRTSRDAGVIGPAARTGAQFVQDASERAPSRLSLATGDLIEA